MITLPYFLSLWNIAGQLMLIIIDHNIYGYVSALLPRNRKLHLSTLDTTHVHNRSNFFYVKEETRGNLSCEEIKPVVICHVERLVFLQVLICDFVCCESELQYFTHEFDSPSGKMNNIHIYFAYPKTFVTEPSWFSLQTCFIIFMYLCVLIYHLKLLRQSFHETHTIFLSGNPCLAFVAAKSI